MCSLFRVYVRLECRGGAIKCDEAGKSAIKYGNTYVQGLQIFPGMLKFYRDGFLRDLLPPRIFEKPGMPGNQGNLSLDRRAVIIVMVIATEDPAKLRLKGGATWY